MARTWLITGCSRGLGNALAKAVLEGGDHLVATARDQNDLLTSSNSAAIVSSRSRST
jgi:NAD(P)-dependent dehydrogenase (short-subunit alcohol dehydrogenase family)